MKDLIECENCIADIELKTLYDIALAIGSSLEIEPALEKSLQTLQRELSLKNSAIFLLEDDELNIYASLGFNKYQEDLTTYKVGEGATGLAAKTGEPVVIENVHNDIIFLNKSGNRDKSTISYIAVPMHSDHEVVGVLAANLTKDTKIDFDETTKILTIVSTMLANAIRNHKLIHEEKERLKDLKQYYKMEWDSKVHNFGDIIGDSKKMQEVFNIISRVASSDATILVRGETGTGKELVAAAIHKRSERKEEPFVKLNCAAISDNLIESELFGHEKGAFTDAKEMRKGRFELANGGTLFLDEIGDVSAAVQVKLLRVLQEQEFERVGGSKTIKVDVRLIAATNRNLEKMVEDGEFREDLFYRLNVIPINTPPLKQRGNDIKLLVEFFLEKATKNHKKLVSISDDAMDLLLKYPWPGNVRELENTVERIVLMGDEEVTPQDMQLILPAFSSKEVVKSLSYKDKTLDEMEKEMIVDALERSSGNQTEAAKSLGITLRQIGYKIKSYGIKV
jgi:Nif-specific regulatory protein